MLCSKCGTPIKPDSQNCSKCGTRVQQGKESPSTQEIENQNKSAPAWFKLFLVVVILGSIAIGYHFFNPRTGLQSVAEGQLAALRSHHIDKAYYDFSSREYQAKHSLAYFRELVHTNPVLSENKTANFYQEGVQNQLGTLSGTLVAKDQSTAPVIYQFTQEEGKWKVLSLQLLESGALRTTSPSDIALEEMSDLNTPAAPASGITKELKTSVEGQLEAIKSGSIDKAYDDYVSKEFRQATSLDAFKDFVKSYPELSQYKTISFGEGRIDEEQGKISVILVTDSQSYPVDYVLVKENNTWKIWGFRMLNPLPPKAPSSASPQAIADASDTTQVSADNQQELSTLVEKHLKSLKDNELKKVYDQDASKEFKEATPLESYQEFVKSYPEFSTFETLKIGKIVKENDLWMVPVTLTTSKGTSDLEFRFVKEDGQWKIWGIQISSSASRPKIDEKERQTLSQIIESVLTALRNNEISKAYYAFTSKEFEKATSFEAFKEFLTTYPIFTTNTKDVIGDGFNEGDLKVVRVELQRDRERYDVDFQFTKEGEKWKIWGIKIFTDVTKVEAPQDKEKVLSVIKDQLNAIKGGDLSKAYYAYSSDTFQDVSSESDFKKFIADHPVLGKNKTLDPKDVTFDRNRALVTAVMTADDGTTKWVEYRLIFQDEHWKVLSIQMRSEDSNSTPNSSPSDKPSAMKFSKALIGTKVDLQGLVTNPATSFKADKSELTVNVYVQNGTKGSPVELQMEHVDSGSKIPPVKVDLEKTGDSVVTFVFSPPTQGWPAGDYKLHVSSAAGAQETYQFKME